MSLSLSKVKPTVYTVNVKPCKCQKWPSPRTDPCGTACLNKLSLSQHLREAGEVPLGGVITIQYIV